MLQIAIDFKIFFESSTVHFQSIQEVDQFLFLNIDQKVVALNVSNENFI
jgi:hypothetical protein